MQKNNKIYSRWENTTLSLRWAHSLIRGFILRYSPTVTHLLTYLLTHLLTPNPHTNMNTNTYTYTHTLEHTEHSYQSESNTSTYTHSHSLTLSPTFTHSHTRPGHRFPTFFWLQQQIVRLHCALKYWHRTRKSPKSERALKDKRA